MILRVEGQIHLVPLLPFHLQKFLHVSPYLSLTLTYPFVSTILAVTPRSTLPLGQGPSLRMDTH